MAKTSTALASDMSEILNIEDNDALKGLDDLLEKFMKKRTLMDDGKLTYFPAKSQSESMQKRIGLYLEKNKIDMGMTRKIRNENGQVKTLHFMIDPKDPGTDLIKERFSEVLKEACPDFDADTIESLVNKLHKCTKDKDDVNGTFHIKY